MKNLAVSQSQYRRVKLLKYWERLAAWEATICV